MTNDDRSLSPYLALFWVQIFFGTFPVIGKVALAVIPAVALVGFRVGFTAAVLVVYQTARRRVWLSDRRDYLRLAGISLLGVTFNQLLFTTGLSLTKASNTSLLAVTIPVFALAAGAVLGTERLGLQKLAGIIFAAVGVILLIDPRSASFSSETTIGDMLIVLNSLSYGIYVAISKGIVTRNGAMRSMMWVFVFAAIVCVPLGFVSMQSVDVAVVERDIWLAVFYVSLIGTAMPYLLNAWALTRVDPSTVAVFIYLQPVIGFLMAVAFLNETVGLNFVAAAILVFAGVYLVTKKFVPTQT